LQGLGTVLEVLQNGQGVVPNEKRVDLMKMSQAGGVALGVLQDFQTQSSQLEPLQFQGSLLLSLFL
jgi:hypothetical protein